MAPDSLTCRCSAITNSASSRRKAHRSQLAWPTQTAWRFSRLTRIAIERRALEVTGSRPDSRLPLINGTRPFARPEIGSSISDSGATREDREDSLLDCDKPHGGVHAAGLYSGCPEAA